MEKRNLDSVQIQALRLLVKKCPRLRTSCYWAGASSIALEELHHRQSFDLDFHTKRALLDVRPILTEIKEAFPNRFEIVSQPELTAAAKDMLKNHDALLITERLLSWSDQDIREDLSLYLDVNPNDAVEARDLILSWLKEGCKK